MMKIFQKLEELEKESKVLPYIYAIIGYLTMVFMQIFMKLIAQELNSFYVLFIRGLFLTIINTVVLSYRNLEINQPDPLGIFIMEV
jgi:hypothetical protein